MRSCSTANLAGAADPGGAAVARSTPTRGRMADEAAPGGSVPGAWWEAYVSQTMAMNIIVRLSSPHRPFLVERNPVS